MEHNAGSKLARIGAAATITMIGGTLFVNGQPVQAATFSVTNTNDSGAGSLRQALYDANNSVGADVVDASGITGVITLQSGLYVTDDLQINGPGSAVLAVTYAGGDVIYFGNVTAGVAGLTISDSSGAALSFDGIQSLSTDDVVLSDNLYGISGEYAGILDLQATTISGSDSKGVAIGFGVGVFTMADSDVIDNGDAGVYFRSVYGSAEIQDSTISGNGNDLEEIFDEEPYGAEGEGSGLNISYLYGSLDIIDTEINDNIGRHGGGIEIREGGREEENVAVTLQGVTVSGNSIEGGSSPVPQNHGRFGQGGGIRMANLAADVLIQDSVISDNTTFGEGGGAFFEIYSEYEPTTLTIRRTSITGNEAEYGGGIVNDGSASSVLIEDSVIDGNSAHYAGGMYLDGEDVEIVRSTISNNTSEQGASALLASAYSVTILNSTVAGNSSTEGPVIELYDVEYASIAHSTVSGNTVGGGSSAVVFSSERYDERIGSVIPFYGGAAVTHSIITGNGALALEGGVVAVDHSLLDAASAPGFDADGNVFADDPLLGALADNGGSTETMLPLAGSLALEAGDPAITEAPETDQRGSTRIVEVIDIGAVEVDAGTVSISPATVTVAEDGGSVVVTVTRSGAADGAATVDVATVAGTATAGADFTAVASTVSFADGESGAKTVSIPILSDVVDPESDETLTVVLSSPSAGLAIGADTATITITNVAVANDAPVISPIADQTTTPGGKLTLPFTVTDPQDDSTITVSVASGSDIVASVTIVDQTGQNEGYFEATTISRAVEVVAGSGLGSGTVTVTASDGSATVTETFQVTVEAAVLPATGSSDYSGLLAAIAAGFVALGSMVRRTARRRH